MLRGEKSGNRLFLDSEKSREVECGTEFASFFPDSTINRHSFVVLIRCRNEDRAPVGCKCSIDGDDRSIIRKGSAIEEASQQMNKIGWSKRLL